MKKNLSRKEQIELKEALSFLHMNELEQQLKNLNLSTKGFNKKELIDRILYFACTGKEMPPITIPAKSKASPNTLYPLAPHTLMLHGSYKNDIETKDFFKSIIGEHFNFTIESTDWLREKWLEEDPPTYAEFAEYWQETYDQQILNNRTNKQKYNYHTFVQNFMKINPKASKTQAFAAWEEKRKYYIEFIKALFNT